MRILISTSYAMNFELRPGRYGEHEVKVAPRSSDWGLRGPRKVAHYTREVFQLCRLAARYDAIALLTAGMEAFILAGFLRAARCPTRVVCVDFLIPHATPALGWLTGTLRRMDAFVCIRSGDMDTLWRRFGIPPDRCSYAPFPCNPQLVGMRTGDEGYVYSAGWAHRDWTTLLCALERTRAPAILSVGGGLPKVDSRQIEILSQRSPEEGRRLMANASLVVLALEDTELPSGPIVLLDAMAMGKAVIITDVNGSRDYVKHGVTAWVVPPGNAAAMASAIAHLMKNPALRRRIGCEAKKKALGQFTPERFVDAIIKTCIAK